VQWHREQGGFLAKVLAAYASKYGATAEIADKIGKD